MIRRRVAFGFGSFVSFVGCLVGTTDAGAQTTTTTAPNIALTQQQHPDRIDVNGNNLGQSTRAQNLNPTGVNYDDCLQNLRLRFTVAVSGFTGNANLQVWATNTGSCKEATARGSGMNPTCWLVNQGLTGLVANSQTTYTFDVWVRDLVGPQSAVPNPAGLGQTQARGEGAGASACTTQPSFLAVPINVWFLALDSSAASLGNPLDFTISTDLIGPPAPTGVSTNDGDTLSIVNWQTNADSDTTSYDVFIDPIPGQEGMVSTAPVDASVLICPDTGSASSSADASDASDSASNAADGANGAADASDDTGSDAGCYTVNLGGTAISGGTTNGSCAASSALSAGVAQNSGTVQTVDDAGNVTSTSGSGGISSISSANLVSGGSTGVTVSDKATGKFTITGLRNGSVYNVAVAAVDGSGNVGPPSTQACASPAPVLDFWATYRASGGGSGGGFCALEAPGGAGPSVATVPLGLAAAALLRRRRKRRNASRSER